MRVNMSDIGDKLKNARKANGMTIEDIEKITKIQRRYLYAIEENQFDQLPGDFYVRAFIKQYAQVVGLNGKELLDEYHKEVPEATPEKYVENSIDNKSQEVRKTTNNKKGLWKQYIPIAAAIIAFFVTVCLIYLIYAHFISNTNQKSINQVDNVTVKSSNEESQKKKKQRVKHKKKATSDIKLEQLSDTLYKVKKMGNKRTLVVKTGSTAVFARIFIDGRSVWHGVLNADDAHQVKIPHNVGNVTVFFANTSSAELIIGGKKLNITNKTMPNAARTITFLFAHKNAVKTNEKNLVKNKENETKQAEQNKTNNQADTKSENINKQENKNTTPQNKQPVQHSQQNETNKQNQQRDQGQAAGGNSR